MGAIGRTRSEDDGSGVIPASEGTIRLLRFGALPGVEVMDVHHVSRQWEYFHETYTLCAASWVANGKDVGWRYRQRTHQMNLTGVQLMEPGELHSNTEVAPSADFRVLMLSPELFATLGRCQGGCNRAAHFNVAQLQGGPVRTLVCELTAALVEDADLERAELGLHRLMEALELQRCFELPGLSPLRERGRKAVRRVRDLIHASWNQHLPLAALSDEAGLPVPTLERAFREMFGTSPRQYQIHLRLTRGRVLLAQPTLPIIAAAEGCGFSDPKYFARLFKREFGCRPSEYRLAGVGGRPPTPPPARTL